MLIEKDDIALITKAKSLKLRQSNNFSKTLFLFALLSDGKPIESVPIKNVFKVQRFKVLVTKLE